MNRAVLLLHHVLTKLRIPFSSFSVKAFLYGSSSQRSSITYTDSFYQPQEPPTVFRWNINSRGWAHLPSSISWDYSSRVCSFSFLIPRSHHRASENNCVYREGLPFEGHHSLPCIMSTVEQEKTPRGNWFLLHHFKKPVFPTYPSCYWVFVTNPNSLTQLN